MLHAMDQTASAKLFVMVVAVMVLAVMGPRTYITPSYAAASSEPCTWSGARKAGVMVKFGR